MSEEENVFLKIRENSGGFFNRGYSDSRSTGETQGGNITKLLESSPTNWQGTVNLGSGKHPDVQYAAGPFEALTRKTETDVLVENAPYYLAIGATSLYGGSVIGSAAAGLTEGLGLPLIAKGAIDTSAFLLGATATHGAAQKGLDLAGIKDATGQDKAFAPGPYQAAQFLPTAALFGNLAMPKTLGEVAGAGIFGTTVAGHSLITGAFDPNRTTGQVAADAALEGAEALGFGLFARPTSLGRPILQAGHYTGQNNPIYRGAVKNIYTDNGRAGTWDNSHGRGGIGPNTTGGVTGYEPAKPEGDGTIGVPVIYGHPNKPQPTGVGPAGAPELPRMVPTASGRGDSTNYDPARGTITVTSAQPDGTAKVTVYTNMGGQKLKAEGPYAKSPDVFSVSFDQFGNVVSPNGPQEPGLTPPNWSENAAANEAAATAAKRDATRKKWQEESVTVADAVVPPEAAEPHKAAEPPKPAPPKPAEPPVAATAPEVKPVVPPVVATESTGPVVHVKPVAPRPQTPPVPVGTDGSPLSYDHPDMRAWGAAYEAQRPAMEAWDTKWQPTHWPDGTPKPASYVEGTPEHAERLAREEQEKKDKEIPKPPITLNDVSLPEDAKPKDPTDDPMFIPLKKGHVRPYPEDGAAPGARETWVQMHGKTHNFDGSPIADVDKPTVPTVLPVSVPDPSTSTGFTAPTPVQRKRGVPAKPGLTAPILTTKEQDIESQAAYLFQNFGENFDMAGGWDGLAKSGAKDKLKGLNSYSESDQELIKKRFNQFREELKISKEEANKLFNENAKLADQADKALQTLIELRMAEGMDVSDIKELPEYKKLQAAAQDAGKKVKLKNSFEELQKRNRNNSFAEEDAAHILEEKPENRAWRYRDLLSQAQDDYKAVLDAKLKQLGIMSEDGKFESSSKPATSETKTAPVAPIAPVEPALAPATREELLAGTRPMKDAPKEVTEGLTPEERKTYLANRAAVLEGRPVTPPASTAGEVVVAATATETSAVEAAVKPGTAVDTPTQAADKVETEIERLIDLGDTKTAGDVHRKVINTLKELLEHSKTVEPLKDTKETAITTKHEKEREENVVVVNVGGKEMGVIKKIRTKQGNSIYLSTSKEGASRGLDNRSFEAAEQYITGSNEIHDADIDIISRYIKDKFDPRRYVVRIPGDGTFSIKQSSAAVESLLKNISSQGPSAWQGIVSKTPARRETPRVKKFSETLTAGDKKELQELLESETKLLAEDNEFLIRRGISRSDVQEGIESIKKALAAKPASEETSKTPAIPDPQGRKNVLVQSAVVGERDKDTDRLQVVGVDAPGEIHKSGMKNPEPLELESPGGPSTESWGAYILALEREGSKNVHIVRLPGTKEGGKPYNMAITGFISVKFKKGKIGGVIPVLNSVGLEDDNKRTNHWLNWKIVEFYPEAVDDRGGDYERWSRRDPRYSGNLAEAGGKVFGEIQNSPESKKAFIARLFATFEVFVPSEFEREGATYGFDAKPTLYFNQSAMIEAEKAEMDALRGTTKPEDASPKEMTVADHWQVEKDREEAAQKVRTPIAAEAPEGAKSKAQIQAESKVEGAKRYGASGVRFNIGGPKNPDSFGGEIRGEKGVVVASTSENWNEKYLKLIKDYLSADAAVLRNMGYPKFYFNSHISGEDSNWVSAPVPAANGNFLVYELNPAGSGAKGNSHNRTSRLFRRLVNSDGVQVGSMTEIYRGELVGMTTTSLAADGKPKFQVPAAFHAMMAAAQDSLASRQMTEGQVNYSGDVTNPNPLNKRIALSGAIHEDLKVFEENELSIPGLRDKMEVFNGLNGGESVNSAIVQFMGDPNESTAAMLASQLQTNALYAAADARSLIDQMAAQMGLADGTYALVSEPHSDDLYPTMKAHKIYPTEAQLMLKWIEAGYQRIIYEIGKHNEDTGEELPDKIPAMLNGKPRMLPNGKPMMINNPMKWNAPVAQWMDAETFAVRDKDGNVTFMPKPHQVVGPNAAMSRWFPAGVVSAPRPEGVQPRAILINDAPGTGKTLQMLMAAVLYRQHLMKLIADPASPWFGAKLQPVLIVTQNAQIIQNAFRGDSEMAKINLNGKFTEKGFEPDEYELLPDGGRILKGNSWIDIATYNSIKPVEEKVLQYEKDGKTPIMVDAFVRDEDGEIMKGPDGKGMPAFDPVKIDKDGIPVRLKEHAFKLLAVGPPKKGYGRWGVVMFDESHNMKNQESGRSDAGFEIMAQAQHVMLASGTPIDKPTQLGPLLGMLLDVPIGNIAEELGMRLTEEKRDERVTHIKRVEGSDIVLERPTLNFGSVPWDNPTELDTYFANLFLKLKMLRDRAGRGGAILRRSTKYFGIENIWMDPSDTMHEAGRDLLMKMHEWWYNEMAAAAEGGGSTNLNVRTLKGMMLFEMKRAAALAKCQLPGTIWNPGSEPLGASKLLLEELAEGRKVILTMDTSNEYGLADSDKIRKFRGLKNETGGRLAYESEYVLWSKFLTERGIRFGIIKGGIKTSEREAFVAEYQKNNPDLSVIIMTTMSGGTGLSIDDRHGVGGKSNPKKQYTPAELDKMKQIAAEEVEGEKIVSGSFPRTMIIVSSPWGGDVFIQAMGRTDRLLSTTPSRIIVLTTGLSEGDDKLIGLVRLKTMAVEAMNKSVSKGDALMGAVVMDAGLEAGGDQLAAGGVNPVKEMDGVEAAELTKEQKATQAAFYKNKSKNILRRHRAMAMSVATANEEKIANAEKNKSSNRELKRWEDSASLAREYVQYLDDISAKFLSGQISDTAIITGEKEHSFEEFKKRKAKTRGEESYEDEDGLVDDNNMTVSLPFGSSVIPVGQGPQIPLAKLSRRGKVSRARKAIDGIYGLHHTISGGTSVTPETLERIEKTVVSIAQPYIKLNSEGKLADGELTAILRMASDVSKLIYRYDFLINTGDKKLDVEYGGQMSFTGRAIMSNLTGMINGETVTHTAFHEIGHAIWESMPEPEKLLVIEELKKARVEWQQGLEDTNPLKSVVFPTVNWLRGEAARTTTGRARRSRSRQSRTLIQKNIWNLLVIQQREPPSAQECSSLTSWSAHSWFPELLK